jgi:NADPH:quinone reductase-like Zn-dependent oxidoreductase
MLHHAAQVESGQRIFVHGLSGAVGGTLLALAKLQGAEVFGTASPRKHEALRLLGAVPFDYSNKMWIDAMNVRDGVDAAFDPLGFKSFDESYSILRKGGILVGYGLNLPGLSGSKPPSVLPAIVKLLARELAVLVRETNDIFWRNPFIETLHPGSGAAIRVALQPAGYPCRSRLLKTFETPCAPACDGPGG